MEVGLRRCASKYLASVILAACIISPSLANANGIAHGVIQLSITATASPSSIPITSATCELVLLTTDPTTTIDFTEDVTIQVPVANNVVSCTVVAPYYWSLTALTGSIYIAYSVSAMNGAVVTKTTSGGLRHNPCFHDWYYTSERFHGFLNAFELLTSRSAPHIALTRNLVARRVSRILADFKS